MEENRGGEAKKVQEKAQKFISWLITNIVLPILPVVIKLLIVIFADNKKISVAVLDSMELLYYNLFICVVFLNLLGECEHIKLIEYVMRCIFTVIILLDLLLIFMSYAEIASYKCSIMAIVLSIVVPIVVSIYQWINMRS